MFLYLEILLLNWMSFVLEKHDIRIDRFFRSIRIFDFNFGFFLCLRHRVCLTWLRLFLCELLHCINYGLVPLITGLCLCLIRNFFKKQWREMMSHEISTYILRLIRENLWCFSVSITKLIKLNHQVFPLPFILFQYLRNAVESMKKAFVPLQMKDKTNMIDTSSYVV